MMKEVTLPSAGHKQKDLISFGLLLRGHISPSQAWELGREWGVKREKEEQASFFAESIIKPFMSNTLHRSFCEPQPEADVS